MPELPEVETTVKGLQRLIGRRIVGYWTDWPKYFLKSGLTKTKAGFARCLKGRKILKISRRGKNIIFDLSGGSSLLVHQKMSGHFLIGKWQKKKPKTVAPGWEKEKWFPVASLKSRLWDPKNKYIRFILFLDSGQMLALSDLRRFANVYCGPKEEILNLPELKKIGPEPLSKSFSFRKFTELFDKKRSGRIKSVLMVPNFISGIGNIYADEILWAAKIHPLRDITTLTKSEKLRLYSAMKRILKKAIELQGTSIDDYRTPQGQPGRFGAALKAYQQTGQKCRRCGAKIKRIKINSRSTHFCPNCQKI